MKMLVNDNQINDYLYSLELSFSHLSVGACDLELGQPTYQIHNVSCVVIAVVHRT